MLADEMSAAMPKQTPDQGNSFSKIPGPDWERIARGIDYSFRWDAFGYYAPLQRLLEAARLSYNRPEDLSDAATVASITPKYLSTYFRSKTGVTFNHWLGLTRVAKALSLMSRREVPVQEVAVLVGFGSVRTMERTFRKFLGSSPKAIMMAVRPEPDRPPKNVLSILPKIANIRRVAEQDRGGFRHK